MQPETKKCTRQVIRSCATKVIPPCFVGGNDIDDMDSVATSMPVEHPWVWSVRVSDLPCNCQHCIIDQNNNIYTYTAWRCTYSANMKIDCVGLIKAMSWVNCAVSCMVNGKWRLKWLSTLFLNWRKGMWSMLVEILKALEVLHVQRCVHWITHQSSVPLHTLNLNH